MTTFTFGGKGYAIVNDPKSWTAALADAQSLSVNGWSSGNLAVIESGSENAAIFNALSLAGVTSTAADGGGAIYAWIGLYQGASPASSSQDWMWVSGSSSYTNWGNGVFGGSGPEPDDLDNVENGQQDFGAMGLTAWPISSPGSLGSAGEWNDLSGTNTLAYVVEFEAIPEPTVGLLVLLGTLGLSNRRAR